jgi:hypothetical protein
MMQEADNLEGFLAAHQHLGFVTAPRVLRRCTTHRYGKGFIIAYSWHA